MKEANFKQISLFDEETEELFEEDQKEKFQKAKKNYLKGLVNYLNIEEIQEAENIQKELRTSIYSKVYSFKECLPLIEYLIEKEFKDHFKKTEFVALLLELAFDDLKNEKNVDSFEDLFAGHYESLIEEKRKNDSLIESFRNRYDELFKEYEIFTEEEKEEFLSYIDHYSETAAKLESYSSLEGEALSREEDILLQSFEFLLKKYTKEELKKKGFFPDIESMKENLTIEFETIKKEIEAFLQPKGIQFNQIIIERFLNLGNEMYIQTDSEYFSPFFRDYDYIVAFKIVKAALINDSRAELTKEEIQEGLNVLKYFEEGLQIIKRFLPSQIVVEEIETPIEEEAFIPVLKKQLQDLQEEGKDFERQEELQKLISLIERNSFDMSFSNTSKLRKKILLNSQLGEKSFQVENVKIKEFNIIEVTYNFDLLDNKGKLLTQEYKPIVNAVLSWYVINGKSPFSLIQLYEIYYNKTFQNKSQQDQKNLEELEKALDEMRLLTMRIRFTEETVSIDEATKEEITEKKEYKYFNYFLPMKKMAIKTTRYKSHGKEVEMSNDSYYQIIDVPPIYEYSRHFDYLLKEDEEAGNILPYNIKDYLNGLKSLPANSKNKLIIENLLHKIVLMKKKKIPNKLNYISFFEDYCGIDYSILSSKSKEVLRKKIKTILNGFMKDKIILNYKEYTNKEDNQKSKSGVSIFL